MTTSILISWQLCPLPLTESRFSPAVLLYSFALCHPVIILLHFWCFWELYHPVQCAWHIWWLKPGPSSSPALFQANARNLVKAQRERQEKRHTSNERRYPGTQELLWRTIAAEMHAGHNAENFNFQCAVCNSVGSVNKTIFTRNVIKKLENSKRNVASHTDRAKNPSTLTLVMENRLNEERASDFCSRRNHTLEK